MEFVGTPHSIVREAAEMLLRLGPESYRPDIVEQEGDRLGVSPYAGKQVKLTHVQHTTVGPNERPCNRHVAAIFGYGRDEIMVYGQVTYNDDGPSLIQLSIYINGKYVINRNVSVQGDKFDPWGTPDGFDPYAR